MPIGPESGKKFVVNAPPFAAAPSFARQTASNEVTGASRKTLLVGETYLTNPVNVRAKINFGVEALKEIDYAVKQWKAEVMKRILDVRNVRSGAEFQAAISNRAANQAATGAPSIWTPLGNVDLPFIKTADPNAPRYDPTTVVAMCLGAENEMAKELTKVNALIQQVARAISDLQQ